MFWNTFTIPRSKSTMALILWLTYTTSCKLGSKNDQIWDLWSTNQKRITYVHNMHVQGVQKCTNRMLLEPWCTDSITTALNFGYDFVLLLHFFGPSRVAEVGSRMQKWPQNFHHAHICYFRDKFVVFALNWKFASLICNKYHLIVHSLPKKQCTLQQNLKRFLAQYVCASFLCVIWGKPIIQKTLSHCHCANAESVRLPCHSEEWSQWQRLMGGGGVQTQK